MWQEHVVASVCIPKEMGHFTEEHVVGNTCRGTWSASPERSATSPQVIVIVDGTAVRGLEF